MADLISGGRFVLGVGQGYVQHEFETLGFDRKYRPSRFEEGIEVIRRACEKGRTGYEGKRWRFEDLPFEPRPERPPPIYVGAFADPAIDRAARLADGFLASTGGGALADTYRRVRDALARHGRADEEVPFVASGVLYVHEDSERASPTWRPPSPTSAAATPSGAPTGTGRDPHRSSPRTCRGRGTWSEPGRGGRGSDLAPQRGSVRPLLLLGSPAGHHPRAGARSMRSLRLRGDAEGPWRGGDVKAAPETLSPEQAAFLVRQRVARLATADAAGAPHAVPVCFAFSRAPSTSPSTRSPRTFPRRA